MRLEVETPAGTAWVDLDRPPGAAALLVLTHGAGGGVATVDVTAIRDAAVAGRIAVALVTQPYRVAGRRSPPAPAPQDAAWLAVMAALRRRVRRVQVVTGGRSNGARVACRTAGLSRAVGVVALAFPLHPPGRPDKSRLAELAQPNVPVLVVQGDRDPFGMPPAAPGRTIHVVAGADHALRRATASTAATVVEFVTTVVTRASVGS